MIRIDGISLRLEEGEEALQSAICRIIGQAPNMWHIYRRAVDARRKEDIRLVYSVIASCHGEQRLIAKKKAAPFSEVVFDYPRLRKKMSARPVVVGSGPAGSFAALCLAHAGAEPVILERGCPVNERTNDVERFFSMGALNPSSNVQFGEGGAGTFSDGKLTTGTNSPYIRKILADYVRFGAPENILVEHKPHIGTDHLKTVAYRLRNEVEHLGGTYRFKTQVTDLRIENGRITGVYAGEWIDTDCVIFAIGHSARDTFELLWNKGFVMEQKPFSVGVRIEHRQDMINQSQYGAFARHKALPPADYKFGGDCYTFCMCPGGFVVASSSQAGGIVTNGMSYAARDGENANSALLVNVDKHDFGDGIFDGMNFQQTLEKRAYAMSDSYAAPCQTLGDFFAGQTTTHIGSVFPTYRPGVFMTNLHKLLPKRICDKLQSGIADIGQKLAGFDSNEALLTGPETRSSSPVRVLRSAESLQAIGISGFYPCGEGAGYAGGIMSAAADGIRCAVRVVEEANTRG